MVDVIFVGVEIFIPHGPLLKEWTTQPRRECEVVCQISSCVVTVVSARSVSRFSFVRRRILKS